MHTQCSENKPVKVKFYCIYIISNGVCTCVPSLGLLAPAFQEKQAKTHKKAKMGYLDSIDLEHCTTTNKIHQWPPRYSVLGPAFCEQSGVPTTST